MKVIEAESMDVSFFYLGGETVVAMKVKDLEGNTIALVFPRRFFAEMETKCQEVEADFARDTHPKH